MPSTTSARVLSLFFPAQFTFSSLSLFQTASIQAGSINFLIYAMLITECQVSCMTCDTNVTCTGSTCNGTYVWNTAHNLCICENPTVSSFYNLQLETCQAVCTQGYYGDTTTGVCEKCHEFCAKCADDTNENCELCATDIYRLDTLKCVDSCPADTHVANSGTYVCDPCESPCLNCNTFAPCSFGTKARVYINTPPLPQKKIQEDKTATCLWFCEAASAKRASASILFSVMPGALSCSRKA